MELVRPAMRLVDFGRKEVALPRWLSSALGTSAFAILIALSSWVRVPLFFTPVPVTLQTFFVLAAGLCLGRKLGAAAAGAVIVGGVAGLPAFAGPVGCTGGYLVGFVAGAYVAGLLAGERPGFSRALGAAAAGSVVILAMGTLWLGAVVGLEEAAIGGLLPFLPGDALKALAAASLVSGRALVKEKEACTTS